jgi:hypothetical protein
MAPKKKATTKKDKTNDDCDPHQRFRNAVATLNNYSDTDVEKVKGFFHTQCSYGVFAYEVGESGTPHLQMYFELNTQLSLSNLRKKCPGSNFQPGYAPEPKARAGYCKKGNDKKKEEETKDPNYYQKYFDTPGPGYEGYEWGKISQKGQRTDLKEITDKIRKAEMSVRQLREENPMAVHQYGRVLQEVENDGRRYKYRHPNNAPYNFFTECIWIHGKPGRGKSHAAYITELESVGGYNPDKIYNWDKRQKFQCS